MPRLPPRRTAAPTEEAESLGAWIRDRTAASRAARERTTQLRMTLTEIAGRREALRIRTEETTRAAARTASRRDALGEEAAQLDGETERLEAEEGAARARCQVLRSEERRV